MTYFTSALNFLHELITGDLGPRAFSELVLLHLPEIVGVIIAAALVRYGLRAVRHFLVSALAALATARSSISPDLTEAQRTKLCDVIVASKDAYWAYLALRNIPNLKKAQRSALQKIASGA